MCVELRYYVIIVSELSHMEFQMIEEIIERVSSSTLLSVNECSSFEGPVVNYVSQL